MPEKDIAAIVGTYIATEAAGRAPEGPLAADFPLIEGGLVDSLALFKLIAFMEDNLDISIAPEDILFENFATLNAIVALVESKATS